MYTLRMLGTIGLSDAADREVDALLRQPKHLGLLAYLSMPKPGVWHRRDLLVVTFWPELDQSRARSALRSALHMLRQHLPEGVIRNRGDGEVSIDPALVVTDVATMADEFAAANYASALNRYKGVFLAGLHIPEARGFEEWLDVERGRLNVLARRSASALVAESERAGNPSGAVDAARRAVELDPDDESSARRLIDLLNGTGDRAQALAVYERLRARLVEEFGSAPSRETAALMEAVRARTGGGSAATPELDDLPRVGATRVAGESETEAASDPPRTRLQPLRSARVERWKRWIVAAAVGLIGAASVFGALSRSTKSAIAASPRRLVVLPVDNETGDRDLDYVGSGVAEGVARRLSGIGGLTILSGARSEWPATTRHDFKSIGEHFGATILLRTEISRGADSLDVNTTVVDAATSVERKISRRRFTLAGISDVESKLAADVAGMLFRVPLPAMPRTSDRAIDPESYRLMLEGWHQQLAQHNTAKAKQLFLRATEIDPLNARAWSGLSSSWAAQITAANERIPFDAGYDRSVAAAERALALDSLQGTAWANLALMRALKYGNLASGKELLSKASAAEPGNPEIFLVAGALYKYGWRWSDARDAMRFARTLDPLTPYYLHMEATVEECADRPQAALTLYRSELELSPAERLAQTGMIRAFARLGQYDSAIATWRLRAHDPRDSVALDALTGARGREGYWAAVHKVGHRRVEALEAESKTHWVSPVLLMQAKFAAGDADGGYKMMEVAGGETSPALFRLRCMGDLDEVRNSPRFKAAVERIGALPLK
jgi:DNA-binding SARP family transcriptional activator/TolB-like protein